MTKTIYLIDSFSYIFQAFYAIGRLTASDGTPTNAVYGMATLLMKLKNQEKADYIAAVFDRPEPTFRHKKYPLYKANRDEMPEDLVPQIDFIKQVIRGFGIPIFEKSGYEADDIIATIAKELKDRPDLQVRIISKDKDLRQILAFSDSIRFYDTKDGSLEDRGRFNEKFAIEPEQIADYLGLVGDSSDNIPGVQGIGPKGASKLLADWKTLDGIYGNIEKLPKNRLRENLETGRDRAYISRDLAILEDKVPIQFDLRKCQAGNPNHEELFALLKKLDLNQIVKRLQITGELSFPSPRAKDDVPQEKNKNSQTRNYKRVETISELKTLAELLKRNGRFTLDTETTHIDPMRASLVGLSFSMKSGEAWYVPVMAPLHEKALSKAEALKIIKPILEDASLEICGQNPKYDMLVLRNEGCEVVNVVFDTMLADYLLDPSYGGHDLDSLSLRHLGMEKIPTSALLKTTKGQPDRTMDQVELDKITEYACEDADATFQLWEFFAKKIKAESLDKVFSEIEMPLIPVLRDMQWRGIRVDKELLQSMSREISNLLLKLEETIYKLAGEIFNISSTKQLAVILFEKLKLIPIKKTKTGFSTDASVLEELATQHELPRLLMEYRELSKLKSTYTDALPEMVNPKTAKIHSTFNQTIAATGRLSSTDPNLQNIPIRTAMGKKIRKAFVPDSDGDILLSADYSQIELRMIAHYSGDKTMIHAFNNDEDIHCAVAASIYGIALHEVKPEMRQAAKTVNFGIIYGQTPHGLSKQLGISRAEAYDFISSYFKQYPGVKSFIDGTIEDARKSGMVETISGRRRKLEHINAKNKMTRENAERMAVNTVIQGSAADLIKIAMLNLDKRLKLENLRAKILLQIHDELVLNLPKAELHKTSQIVEEEMSGALKLKVKLKVDIGSGPNWLDAK